MNNVGFTVRAISGSQSGKYVYLNSDGTAGYSTSSRTLITNYNGEINITNLFVGRYEIRETVNPNYGYEVSSTARYITISPYGAPSVTIDNVRNYVKYSGYVWEDINGETGKEGNGNGLYRDNPYDNKDQKVKGVTVRLKYRTNGNTIQTTTTDTNGRYVFENVNINEISNYYIEFEYNGMCYTVVEPKYNKDNGSKASEIGRNTFNNSYETIVAGSSNKYSLEYSTSNNISTLKYANNLNYLERYVYGGKENPVTGTYGQYLIYAETLNLSSIKSANDIRNNKITEISNVNLGIQKREKPDLSLKKDLLCAKVSINGAQHTYNYGDRFKNIAEYGDGHDALIKFGQKYKEMSYTRPLYASDIKYEGDNELNVRVIYQIEVKNTSTNLKVVINSIDDYYDTKYRIIAVGNNMQDGNVESNLKWDQAGSVGEYNKIQINPNLSIDNQGASSSIYIELEVNSENIEEIVDKGKNVKLDNLSEISSYSIKDSGGNTYAGIDVDSQPGNLDVTSKDRIEATMEDDTDKAPGLLLVLQEPRKIIGTVFLDESGNDLKTGETRNGDGEYKSNEDYEIEGIKVKLIKQDNEETVIETKTGKSGEYVIEGFIPDKYCITYTWGGQTYKINPNDENEEKTILVQNYKCATIEEGVWLAKQGDKKWYNTDVDIRYSDALDDYVTRETIDGQIENIDDGVPGITYGIKAAIESGNNDYTKEMISTTPSFQVDIENTESNVTDANQDSFHIENIDFGIVERARQALQLDKDIKSVKITLTNGNVLVNAEVDEKGALKGNPKYVTLIPRSAGSNGQIKIEIDQEIIQGATLEIVYGFKITNVSEVEYISRDYYLYGKTEGNKATLTPKSIIDYLDNNIVIDMTQGENNVWDVVENAEIKEKLIDSGLVDGNLEETLKSTNRIIKMEGNTDYLSGQELEPGEYDGTNIKLKAYKLLSNNDETILDNHAEIIQLYKAGGAVPYTTPGNYNYTTQETSEIDNSMSGSLVILPPTGLTADHIAYIILGISSLGILVAGIILIKKIVLK